MLRCASFDDADADDDGFLSLAEFDAIGKAATGSDSAADREGSAEAANDFKRVFLHFFFIFFWIFGFLIVKNCCCCCWDFQFLIFDNFKDKFSI